MLISMNEMKEAYRLWAKGMPVKWLHNHYQVSYSTMQKYIRQYHRYGDTMNDIYPVEVHEQFLEETVNGSSKENI